MRCARQRLSLLKSCDLRGSLDRGQCGAHNGGRRSVRSMRLRVRPGKRALGRHAGPSTRTSVGDSGPIYIFVSEVTAVSDQDSKLFVFPPDPPKGRINIQLRLLVDAFGNNYHTRNLHRILSSCRGGLDLLLHHKPGNGQG